MKTIGVFVVVMSFFLYPVFSGEAQEQEVQTPAAPEAVWVVKVFYTARSDDIDRYGGPQKRARDNHKWLILGLEVQPPKMGADVDFEEIRVAYGSEGRYPALAVDHPRETLQGGYTWHRFLFFEDARDPQAMVDRFFFANENKWMFAYKEGAPVGAGILDHEKLVVVVLASKMVFFQEQGTRLFFLFEVPVGDKQLILEFAEGVWLPVR